MFSISSQASGRCLLDETLKDKENKMKITLSVEELKVLLNCIYGTQCLANTDPDMHMNKPEEPTVLSDDEVHNNIVRMCMKRKLVLYINEVPEYITDSPNYDMIAERLYPYDGEIVSIINDEKDEYKWHVHTI